MSKKSVLTKPPVIIGWLVCCLGAIFYTYEYLLRIEPSIMVQQLMHKYDVNAAGLGLLVSLYYIAYTPMQLFVGMITDRYGPRRVLTGAIMLCAIGALVFYYAANIYLAGAGRFLIGFGSAFAFVGVLKLGTIWLPRKRFALFAGLATALGMVGAMVGDVELSLLVGVTGWEKTLFYSGIAGLLLMPMIWFVVRDRPAHVSHRQEVNALSYKETFSALKKIFKNRQLWMVGFVGAMLFMSLSVFAELWGYQFLEQVYHLSSERAAETNSLVFMGWLFGAPFMGWLSDRIGVRKTPLIFGCVLSCMTFLVIVYVPSLPLMVLSVLLFLFGFFSSTEVLCFAMAKDRSLIKVAGTALAFINMIVMAGGMICQPLVGWLMVRFWDGRHIGSSPLYTSHAYRWALLTIPVGLLLATLVATRIRRTYHLRFGSQSHG